MAVHGLPSPQASAAARRRGPDQTRAPLREGGAAPPARRRLRRDGGARPPRARGRRGLRQGAARGQRGPGRPLRRARSGLVAPEGKRLEPSSAPISRPSSAPSSTRLQEGTSTAAPIATWAVGRSETMAAMKPTLEDSAHTPASVDPRMLAIVEVVGAPWPRHRAAIAAAHVYGESSPRGPRRLARRAHRRRAGARCPQGGNLRSLLLGPRRSSGSRIEQAIGIDFEAPVGGAEESAPSTASPPTGPESPRW